MKEPTHPERQDTLGEGGCPQDSDLSCTMGNDVPPLDNDIPQPSPPCVPRVKLPSVAPTTCNLPSKPSVSDLGHGAVQSQELTVNLNVDPAVPTAGDREDDPPSSSSELSVPVTQESGEKSHTAQRTSTETDSSGSRSKTYSIAELVELGYRSRRLGRNELRLSEEAPIEHIFPSVSTERATAGASTFVPFKRTHRRDLSTQSVSSGSDREEFSSKPVHSLRQTESLLRPRRQPRHPPDSTLLQTNAGFAHFLKQHASPPHKRVTAGGRIVPAGPNSPPPTFKMETIDAMIQGNPRPIWPSRYSAPPARLQDMVAPQHAPNPMHNGIIRPSQNGMYGIPVNAGPQRSHTLPPQGPIPQNNVMTVYPGNGPPPGCRLPEGARYVGLMDGIHVVEINGKAGRMEWFNNGAEHWHFVPLDEIRPFQYPMPQHAPQSTHGVQYTAPIPHGMHGYPVQQFGPMLATAPVPHMQNGFPGPMLPPAPMQQHQNGFPAFPGFPGPNGQTVGPPSIPTGFVPTGNVQPNGFVPMSNGQVRGTPFLHAPFDDSPQGIKLQHQALNAHYEAIRAELQELEKYVALNIDECTPMQNVMITSQRRSLIHQLDETRKRKMQLDKHLQRINPTTAVPSNGHSSKSRQSSKTRDQAAQGPSIAEVVQSAIEKDEQQIELHKAAKKFSPDAPVFVPSASAGFCGQLGQRLLEGPKATDTPPRVESPVILPADASYCDRLGFNNPSEPKQFCTEPAEFIKVIKSAHEQARRYGCEGGQSKDPEWDAEQDIRWAMQDELPIPLAPESLDYVFDQGPWNWADSYFNVRKYRAANWMPPRYIQAPRTLPPVRPGRFQRPESVDGGVPLFRAPSAVQHTSSAHSSGKSSLTVIGNKNNQGSYNKGGYQVKHAKSSPYPPQRAETSAQASAQLDSKLSEVNLALLNGDEVPQISSIQLCPLSRQISADTTDTSFVTNFSQEENVKTKEKIQYDAKKLCKKADQLMVRYAANLEQDPELLDAFEPLAQLAQMVKENMRGKGNGKSLLRQYEHTIETVDADHQLINASPTPVVNSNKTSPRRGLEDPDVATTSLINKTNNELKAVTVVPEPNLTKSMTKRQASQFARKLIGNKSQEQGEGFSSTDKASETPRSDAQKRLLAHLNFASGDENTSPNMMYKARSSIASPTFEARGSVHSSGTSMEAQPPTPAEARHKKRNQYTEDDLSMMRRQAYVYTKDWAANEGFRNPSTTSKKQNFPGARASDDPQEPKMTRAQRYQARHKLGHGHKTTEF